MSEFTCGTVGIAESATAASITVADETDRTARGLPARSHAFLGFPSTGWATRADAEAYGAHPCGHCYRQVASVAPRRGDQQEPPSRRDGGA